VELGVNHICWQPLHLAPSRDNSLPMMSAYKSEAHFELEPVFNPEVIKTCPYWGLWELLFRDKKVTQSLSSVLMVSRTIFDDSDFVIIRARATYSGVDGWLCKSGIQPVDLDSVYKGSIGLQRRYKKMIYGNGQYLETKAGRLRSNRRTGARIANDVVAEISKNLYRELYREDYISLGYGEFDSVLKSKKSIFTVIAALINWRLSLELRVRQGFERDFDFYTHNEVKSMIAGTAYKIKLPKFSE
jgi:hypothetical protein